MADVAKAAAVSLQTVSNVINAPHLVRPQTRERVEAVIAATGYRPLKAAQTLRTQRSHLIAVIIPEPGQWKGELHNAFLHALTRRAQKSGYRILLFTAVDDSEEIQAYDQLLTDYTLDAFVLTGTHSADRRTSWLRRKRVPFVTFGRPWGAATHPWVDVDGAHGERKATEHLIAAGHRRIAFLGWPEGSDVGDDRKAGWDQACQAAGLATEGLCARVEDDLALGRQACASLLDAAEPPTAFVCVSDTIALGAWTEITARGLVPGRDLAVIGFDDSAAAAVVGLTSVAQPLDEVADACLVALDKLLSPGGAGQRGARPRVLLEPQLVIRNSAPSSSPSPEKRTP
ncbi:MAG TPA: LacI family DNA-binding transcriptional regulator [Trebonia sp.]|nr:LacI family DNA-binding transcriptional regulator [Trebonia sp.]